jgi:hypothetical protein
MVKLPLRECLLRCLGGNLWQQGKGCSALIQPYASLACIQPVTDHSNVSSYGYGIHSFEHDDQRSTV